MKIDIFELKREIFHMLVGILFVLIITLMPYSQTFLLIVLIIGGFASFLSTQFKLPLVYKFLCLFERQCNRNFPGKGVLFFFVGSLISLQLFEKNIALASILILTFADPVSHFIGEHFGKTTLISKRKYIEGTIVGIAVGTFFASFFVHPVLALIGCSVAMFLETAEVAMGESPVDDNLLIPLISGTVMHLIGLRLGFF